VATGLRRLASQTPLMSSYIYLKKKKKLIVTTPWDALIISNKM